MSEARSYWRNVIARAWAETIPLTPWASLSKAFFHIVPAIAAAFLWFAATKEVAAAGVVAVVLAAAGILTIFLWKLLSVPAQMFAETNTAVTPSGGFRVRTRSAPPTVGSHSGEIAFDYSTNDGVIVIGVGEASFALHFSKASNRSIHFYRGAGNVVAVARVKAPAPGARLSFGDFDSSSRVYSLSVGDVGLAENSIGYFCQIRVRQIADDSRGSPTDQVVFSFEINGSGSADFLALA